MIPHFEKGFLSLHKLAHANLKEKFFHPMQKVELERLEQKRVTPWVRGQKRLNRQLRGSKGKRLF